MCRARTLLRQWWDPEAPSLTAGSVRILESRLRSSHRGVEWGSGNSTLWLARLTAHLVSFESDPAYHGVVGRRLAQAGVSNVDYRLVPCEAGADDEANWDCAFVRAAGAFADESLDYALVDSAPRGCLCRAVVPKLRPAGLLILDNADWFVAPPDSLRPRLPGHPRPALSRHWAAFLEISAGWERLWTSDGVQATLILVKP